MNPRGIYGPELAAAKVASAGKPYQPSNGTEGDCFCAAYCENCRRYYVDDGCPILGLSQWCDIGDPSYPSELVIGSDGQPTCTAFEERESDERD